LSATTETLNLFEQQASNRRRSWWLVAAFMLFFAWLGFGGDLILWLGTRPVPGEVVRQVAYVHRIPWLGIVTTSIGLWIVLSTLRNGAQKVLWSTGAIPLTDARTDPERQLENVVDEMAIAAGVPRPRVYVVPDADPNAFVTGSNPNETHLAVTQGLLDTLNRDELQAVIAHELGHVKNEDTQLMTLIAGLGGAILLLRDGVSRTVFRGGFGRSGGGRSGGKDGKGGGALIIALLVVWGLSWLLAPLIVRLMAMGISRKREYLADAMAAQFTRNPMAQADALDKIERAHHPTKSISLGAAHLCIADPTGRWANSHEGRVADLFATHPPMRLRVSRLRAMAFQAQKRAGDLPSV
jgi:heat shock protein HtpX